MSNEISPLNDSKEDNDRNRISQIIKLIAPGNSELNENVLH